MTIVNDGSIDDTDKIATQLSKNDNVSYVSLEKNMGKWYALNEGIMQTNTTYITSQDADDVSLIDRIDRQVKCLAATNTIHNLCGFYHCWNEKDVDDHKNLRNNDQILVMDQNEVAARVQAGYSHPNINHFYTGDFETAGVSALFDRRIWELGLRFNPPGQNLRILMSEDSDFNFRVTTLIGRTSVLAEKLYCYRRGTSTNEEKV